MPVRCSSFGTANTGPMPISSGSQPATAKPRNVPSGFRPFFSASLRAHHHAGAGAVGELAGIAGRDVAALAHRLERREAFEIGVGAVALVALERDVLDALRLGVLVDHLLARRQRHDLVVEAPGLLARGGAALAFQRILVLRLAATRRSAPPRCRRSRSSASRLPACARAATPRSPAGLRPPSCVRLMLSSPPATMQSASPAMMRCAAIAMVCRPDEQKRFTVTPLTVTGMPGADRRRAARCCCRSPSPAWRSRAPRPRPRPDRSRRARPRA